MIKPSIKNMGLKGYLESTTVMHNGLGYGEFVARIKLESPKTKIAKKFKVEKKTIYRWIEVYEEELNNG